MIALRFSMYLHRMLSLYGDLIALINSAPTVQAALVAVGATGRGFMFDSSCFPESVYEMHGRYLRCIEGLDEIKRLAKAVYGFNFKPNDPDFVFNQEVSFSYACKMCSLVAPIRQHFTGPPMATEIIRAELNLAMRHPLRLDEVCLLCVETPPVEVKEPPSVKRICVRLECDEEMPVILGPSSPCLLCKLS